MVAPAGYIGTGKNKILRWERLRVLLLAVLSANPLALFLWSIIWEKRMISTTGVY